MKKFILSIGLLLGALSLNAGVVYVAPQAVGDSTGSSWDNAMENIQMAINKAKEDPTGTTDVWVKAGTYNIPATIAIKDSVNLYGSFAGTETSVEERAIVEGGQPWEFANPTIINGGDSIPCLNVVRDMVQPIIIDGVILEHGAAQASNIGGAMRIRGNVTLQRSILRNNHNSKDGGGAILLAPAGTITQCLFENNTQDTNGNGGGALHINTTSEAFVSYCVFRNNSSEVRGGAVNAQGTGISTIEACTFYNNKAIKADKTLMEGSALHSGSVSTKIFNCLIYNNTGASTAKIQPIAFCNNTVVSNIGQVYIAGGKSESVIFNNVIWKLVGADEKPVGLAGTTVNGLKAFNNYTYLSVPSTRGWVLTPDAETLENSNVQFASNNTNGNTEEGEGTEGKELRGPHFRHLASFVGAVPDDTETEIAEALMAELDSVDLRVNTSSALLNAGYEWEEITSDRDGNNRPQGGKTDVGAYELNYFTVFIPTVSEEVGLILDEKGNPVAEEVTSVEGGTLALMIMTAEGALPYKVETVFSTDGGMTFNGERRDVTSQINPETFMINLKVEATMQLVVTWTQPIVDYTVTLTVAAGCEEMGTVEGAGTYAAGTEITIKAIAKAGYRFVKWSDENTEAERKIVVNEDLNLSATFEEMSEGFADAVANTLAITAEKNGVRVSGLLQGSTVEVFDINGRQVFTTVAESETLFINLQQGMYIIRQGANRGKAIVK
ncbi:MAG: choice-of-anchor Q domain-containing protein [Paludibacteraceae bacterium]